MNIYEAKREICNTILAYTQKNIDGSYKLPTIRQRPVLLIGPPGIGKTAIMEQAAAECNVGLVAYTITHHTRQSAIGLPVIRERRYHGEICSITEYTMSEIIAAVYDCIEKTGHQEGILFIDEINCVSETLAPAMLQFLQCKTFGNHKVPDGWIIVAAGNPPGYNKSVREFDIVTLDRVRLLNIEANLSVWKEFARNAGVHEAILSFLDIKPQNFYRMESTDNGKYFVTARGWEDLSRMLQLYEKLKFEVTVPFVQEFLQYPMVARDFTAYYILYQKYQAEYPVMDILKGQWTAEIKQRTIDAPYEERITLIHLLLEVLTVSQTENPKDLTRKWRNCFQYLESCYGLGLELQIFLTELRQSQSSISFLLEQGVEEYIYCSHWYDEQSTNHHREQHAQMIFNTLQLEQ